MNYYLDLSYYGDWKTGKVKKPKKLRIEKGKHLCDWDVVETPSTREFIEKNKKRLAMWRKRNGISPAREDLPLGICDGDIRPGSLIKRKDKKRKAKG